MGRTQPVCYFLGLERQFTCTKIAIEQLRNFFRRARLSDLIERSAHMFFQVTVCLWCMSKVRISVLKLGWVGAAHTVVRNVVRNVNKGAPAPQELTMAV